MKWLKAGLVGAVGSLIMFILMMLGIQNGVAPFNVTPSTAFLEQLGLNIGPMPLLVHFGYGIFWSIVFVAVFQQRANIMKGIGLALLLWLGMMLVYSPIIGWGIFGLGGGELAADQMLSLGSPVRYIVATLVLHLLYGLTIGWLNPLWIDFRQPSPTASSVTGMG